MAHVAREARVLLRPCHGRYLHELRLSLGADNLIDVECVNCGAVVVRQTQAQAERIYAQNEGREAGSPIGPVERCTHA